MPFRLFARGTNDYHRTLRRADFGDAYEIAEALAGLGPPARSPRDLARDSFTDSARPDIAASGIFDEIGTPLGTHQFREGFDLLVANQKLPLQINLNCRTSRWTGPDRVSATEAYVRRGDTSGGNGMLRTLDPTLRAAGMSTFGVLTALGTVFDDFGRHALGNRRGTDREGWYYLVIQITA